MPRTTARPPKQKTQGFDLEATSEGLGLERDGEFVSVPPEAVEAVTKLRGVILPTSPEEVIVNNHFECPINIQGSRTAHQIGSLFHGQIIDQNKVPLTVEFDSPMKSVDMYTLFPEHAATQRKRIYFDNVGKPLNGRIITSSFEPWISDQQWEINGVSAPMYGGCVFVTRSDLTPGFQFAKSPNYETLVYKEILNGSWGDGAKIDLGPAIVRNTANRVEHTLGRRPFTRLAIQEVAAFQVPSSISTGTLDQAATDMLANRLDPKEWFHSLGSPTSYTNQLRIELEYRGEDNTNNSKILLEQLLGLLIKHGIAFSFASGRKVLPTGLNTQKTNQVTANHES